MRKKTKVKNSKNTGIGILFILGIVLLLLLALTIKVLDLYQESSFDGKTNYNLKVKSNKLQFLSFSPSSQSISIVTTNSESPPVPTDSKVEGEEVNSENLHSQVLGLVGKNGINPFDSLKLLLFTKSIPDDKIYEYSLNTSDPRFEKELSDIFGDQAISLEKISIEIVNASGVSGAGNKLAQVVTNMGANVILVTSVEEGRDHSEIVASSDSLTYKKIKKMLNLPSKIEENGQVSDIRIVLGKDLKLDL